jgi:8-oxo-dGTP diphosphatase
MNTDVRHLVLVYESMKIKHRVSKIVIKQNNKVLLLQCPGNMKWELPGGHVDPGENFIKCAVRETKEETGLKLDVDKLVELQTTKDQDYKQRVYCYDLMDDKKIKLSDEHVNHEWVSKKKLDKYPLTNSTNHLAIISCYN